MTRHVSTLFLPTPMLLGLGVALTLLTGPRWGIAPLAWLAPIPYLLWARQAHGGRDWAALFSGLLVGYSAQCAIFATPPVPVIGVIAFAPPLALIRFLAVFLAERVRRRLGEIGGVGAYVSTTVVADWIGYGQTEFGAWMATANSQVEWLSFMQSTSVAGLAAPGALMALTASLFAASFGASKSVWSSQRRAVAVASPLLVVSGVLFWGTLRLDQPVHGAVVGVATVATDVGMTDRGLPGDHVLRENTEQLFARTVVAASRGARLVVWNEIATVITPIEEAALITRGRETARIQHIDLVLAYGVVTSTDPLLFDNKYVFIADTGEVLDEYRKHHPVPGEPSIRGTAPLQVLVRPYGRVAGAICYDYDFPALAREHARLHADIVVLPSSDWKGIDPIHTYMARTRAIEGGFSLVRSVRWAASGVFDAHGRIRGWMPATDGTDGVMVAFVPVRRLSTSATAMGDLPVAAALALLIAVMAAAFVPSKWRRLLGVWGVVLIAWTAVAPGALAQGRSQQPSGWSIELLGGWTGRPPTQGGAVRDPLPPGQPFTTHTGAPSTRHGSWFFGDGARLFNQAAETFGQLQGRQLKMIVPLDDALSRPASSDFVTPMVGLRLGYTPRPRWWVALEVERADGPAFVEDFVRVVEDSRTSYVAAFADLLGTAPIADLQVDAATRTSGRSKEFRFLGTITRSLLNRGAYGLHLTAGAGAAVRSSATVTMEIEGRYAFSVNAGGNIAERDRVEVRLESPRTSPLFVAGGGATWMLSRSTRLRVDVRLIVDRRQVTTSIRTLPESLSTDDAMLASYTSPGLQFSGVPAKWSSLGQPLSARRFSSSGAQLRLHISVGYGIRF
ncbi:MAG: hypothetical protein AMXMBFR57_00230 [Acidimicrobiia bacterium]